MDERAARGAVRVALSVAVRALAEDPVTAAWLAVRASPVSATRPLGRVVLRLPRLRPGLSRALAAWTEGGRDAAMAEAARAEDAGTIGSRARLAALALACDRPATAARLLRHIPAQHRALVRLRACVAWREGRLRDAISLLQGAGRHGGPAERARRRQLLRAWQGEVSVLEGAWRPRPTRSSVPWKPSTGRVLHVVTNSLPHTSAGYTLRTHMIARAQANRGLDPHVVTRLGFPVAQGMIASGATDVVDDVMYHRLLPPTGVPHDPAERLDLGGRMLGELVERLRPTILHAATDHLNGQLALGVAERYGIPVVYEVRGFLEDSWLSRREQSDGVDARAATASDRYQLSRAVETACMLRADAVTTLAAVMASEIAERGVDPARITVVPNAVDDDFLGALPDPVELRRSLGFAPDDVVAGTITTFWAHEGLHDLLHATRLLLGRGAPVRLLLVGDGPERPGLQQLARDLGLGDRVVFTGRVPFAQVRRYHAAIDVFTVPRTADRVSRMVTPLKPIEAMASRRPVVASDVPALAELVRHGQTGVLAAPGDPASLADAVEPLLYDTGLRSRLGEAARAWVASDRTWARNADRYANVYRSLGAQLP